MKLLNSLFAPDSNFKESKFKLIGEVNKISNGYKISHGDSIVGKIIKKNQYLVMIHRVVYVIYQHDPMRIDRLHSNNETRYFHKKELTDDDLVDVVRAQMTEFDEFISYLDLVPIKKKDLRKKIDRIEEEGYNIKLFSNGLLVSNIVVSEPFYKINLYSSIDGCSKEMIVSFSNDKIVFLTKEFHKVYHEHGITKEKMIKLVKSQDLSIGNIEKVLDLK